LDDVEEAFKKWWMEQALEALEKANKKRNRFNIKQIRSMFKSIIKFGIQHPKWYVKCYTILCQIWVYFLVIMAILFFFMSPVYSLIIILIFVLPPLFPLWALKNEFTRKQMEKGLVSFVDRNGVERWGTPEQVKEWKSVDITLRTNFMAYYPRKFELFIGELLKRMGYEVEIGNYTQDFGIDLVAKKEGEVVVVEVKKWQIGHNVGSREVRSILGAMWKAGANKALLVTTSDFTESAKEQAREAPIELWNSRVLHKLVEKYFVDERI